MCGGSIVVLAATKVFNWLVGKINEAHTSLPAEAGTGEAAAASTAAETVAFVGILDIFGRFVVHLNSLFMPLAFQPWSSAVRTVPWGVLSPCLFPQRLFGKEEGRGREAGRGYGKTSARHRLFWGGVRVEFDVSFFRRPMKNGGRGEETLACAWALLVFRCPARPISFAS